MSKRELKYRNAVTSRISKETYDNLTEVSLAKKKTRSEIIRMILEDYLK